LALAYKGIQYEYKAVNLLEDQQKQDNYAKLNPMKEIPTLIIDGHTLCQSVAIMEYLEETRPNPPLLPKDPLLRARMRQIVETIAGDIQPLQTLRVLKKVETHQKEEWPGYWIDVGFTALEKILLETSGVYCVKDSVTFADILLVPQIYNARRFGVNMEKFPTIQRVESALIHLLPFKEAHPDAQPDASTER